MSDPNEPGPYDPTRRMDEPAPRAAAPHDRTEAMGARPEDRTEVRGSGGSRAPGPERTQVMGTPDGTYRRAAGEEPIAYTEDYHADDGPATGPGYDDDAVDDGRRTFTLTAMVLTAIAALLVGTILTLLLLPEEEPTVVLADQAGQDALADAQQQNADLAARVAELEGQVAERDQTIAELQEAIAAGGDQADAQQAAADAAIARDEALVQREQALDAREAAQDERDAALAAREEQVAQREQAVAAAEQSGAEQPAPEEPGDGGGIVLPDLPDITIPTDLPQIDEDQARGALERFIDRLQSIFGG